jgi:hypothetical protein
MKKQAVTPESILDKSKRYYKSMQALSAKVAPYMQGTGGAIGEIMQALKDREARNQAQEYEFNTFGEDGKIKHHQRKGDDGDYTGINVGTSVAKAAIAAGLHLLPAVAGAAFGPAGGFVGGIASDVGKAVLPAATNAVKGKLMQKKKQDYDEGLGVYA